MANVFFGGLLQGFKEPLGTTFSIVRANVGYLFFLILLMIVYIYIGHQNDSMVRNINKQQKELMDLKYHFKTVNAKMLSKGEEAHVENQAKAIGLRFIPSPPIKL